MPKSPDSAQKPSLACLTACALCVLTVCLWGLPPTTGARSLDTNAEARKIFHSVMSPFCPGQLLANCTSSSAAALRDSIRAQLARGREPSAVVQELYRTYGESVRATPANEGFGRMAWIGPILALVSGFVLILWWYQQHRRPPPVSNPGAVDPALRERLQEELRSRE